MVIELRRRRIALAVGLSSGVVEEVRLTDVGIVATLDDGSRMIVDANVTISA